MNTSTRLMDRIANGTHPLTINELGAISGGGGVLCTLGHMLGHAFGVLVEPIIEAVFGRGDGD